MNFQADANENYRNEFIDKHLLWYANKYTYFFYKQPVFKQLAHGSQIAKQLSGVNLFSLSNNINYRLKKSGNKEFLFMKTQRVLNRLSKCANVRYHKGQVFLWFTLTSQSKLKKFITLFMRNLPRKTCYEI